MKKGKFLLNFLVVCFTIYLIILIKLIVFKYPLVTSLNIIKSWSISKVMAHVLTANIIPFKTIAQDVFFRKETYYFKLIVYNILAFLPLGFLLPCIKKNVRSINGILFSSFIVSVIFEIFQLVTLLGEADIDDIILNIIGAILGYSLFCGVYIACNKLKIKLIV